MLYKVIKIDQITSDTLAVEDYSNSRLLKKKEQNRPGATEIVFIHDYSYQGNLLQKEKIKWIFKNGSHSLDSVFYYYKDETLIKEVEYRGDASIYSNKTTTEYIAKGDSTIKKKSLPLGITESYKEKLEDGNYYSYNSLNNPTIRKKYNDKNQIIQTEHKTTKNWCVSSNTEYKYDKCGNTVEKMKTTSKGDIIQIERHINYCHNKN